MSAPLIPSPLDHIGPSRFSFRPGIKNAGPNEWIVALISAAEIKAVNAQTGREIWVPRHYCEWVSFAGPLPVVGIAKELEYSRDGLRPSVKRVIEIPLPAQRAKVSERLLSRLPGPAPVIGIRLEDSEDSHTNRALIFSGVGAIAVSVLAALLSVLARL